MQKALLTIESVEFKGSGTNSRGPWKRYNIKASGFPASKWFSAFNMEPAVGETATFIIKDQQKEGKTYYSIEGYDQEAPQSLLRPTTQQPQEPGLAVHVEALFTRMQAVEQEIEKLKAAQPLPDFPFPRS